MWNLWNSVFLQFNTYLQLVIDASMHAVGNVLCSFNKTRNINFKWSCKIMCHRVCLSFAQFFHVNNARFRYSLQYQQHDCPSLCILWSPFGSRRRLKIPIDDLKSKLKRTALQKNTIYVFFFFLIKGAFCSLGYKF